MRRSLRSPAASSLALACALTAVLAGAASPAPAQNRPTRPATVPTGQTPATSDEPGGTDRPSAQPGGSPRAEQARERRVGDSDIAQAPVREIAKSTRHVATIGGRSIAYTATAGTLTLRDDDGKPVASMFYAAYTVPGPNRPVTFIYNGGPGSASLWLHMGSIGPVRMATESPKATAGPPFHVVNNPDSLLDKSDLVFLDMIGAGYSRPLGDAKQDRFNGVDQDVDAFVRAIRRYVSINDRWNSPKFIFGESYGTTRSGALAYALQQAGLQLNGVVLLSSIMNYGVRSAGFDQNYINYLPTFAAAAWYHKRAPGAPADIRAYLQEVREFARGPYALALSKGQDLPAAEKAEMAQRLGRYIGISPQVLIQSDLRLDLGRFRKELLRDQRRTLGRYDSRFEGIDIDAGGESPEYDPSDQYITGAYIGGFQDWVGRELGYETNLEYRQRAPSGPNGWDFRHRAPGSRFPAPNPDTALDLSQAMRTNPHLKVLSMNGWYDMATPFFGTEYDLGHMQLDPTVRPNLSFTYYPSGHMAYLNVEALKQMKIDLARWYDEATAGR